MKPSLVLHTHMPYVEGFGTWPFGEEWLWEAIATSYLPLLDVLDAHPGKVTLSITPVLADQLEAPGALERCLAFLRDVRPASHALDATTASTWPIRVQRYARAADALERRGDLIDAFAPARELDLRRHPRRAAAARHRRRHPAAAGDRDRRRTGALRRLERRLLAARVRARAVAGRAARGGGRARHVRRLGELGAPSRCRTRRRDRARRRSTAQAIDRVWHERGYPSHGDYRDTHRLTPRRHQVWANDGEPTTRSAATRGPRARARVRRERAGGRSSPSTPSSSATTGTRASPASRRCSSSPTSCPSRRDGAHEVAEPRAPDELGRRPRPAHLEPASSPGASAAPSCPRSARKPSARALRELLALQSSDWAFQIYNATAGDYPRERALEHHPAFTSALTLDENPSLRNLAPELADWAFVQP